MAPPCHAPLRALPLFVVVAASAVPEESTSGLMTSCTRSGGVACSEDDVIAQEATETSFAEARFLQVGFAKAVEAAGAQPAPEKKEANVILETTQVGFQTRATAKSVGQTWSHRSRHLTSLAAAGEATNFTRAMPALSARPTEAEKNEFVRRHNVYRCMHGANPVEWDEDVADSAFDYTDPLTQMMHSDSYDVAPPAGPAGENIYWSSRAASPNAAVDAWYSELQYCQPSTTEFQDGCRFGKDGGVTGHFTAMIWTGVKKIGCAFSSNGNIILCRYKADDTLNANTPNMLPTSNYGSHVFPVTKTSGQCESGAGGSGQGSSGSGNSGSGGGSSGGGSSGGGSSGGGSSGGGSSGGGSSGGDSVDDSNIGENSCLSKKGACTIKSSKCYGNGYAKVKAQMQCDGGTLNLSMPDNYEWDLSGYCNSCSDPSLVE